MSTFLQFLKNPQDWLREAFVHYGPQLYAVVALIVFAETGLVFLPFLPGDSLLFALGALSGGDQPILSLSVLYPLLFCAALVGDNLNYWVGRQFGRKLFSSDKSKIFRRSNLAKTEAFFEKHGGKAIILARFVPIVRTFAPFVAGMGRMEYGRFLLFSVTGAILWVGVCVTAGYLFGSLPAIKKNFEVVVLGIVFVSVVPMVVEFLNHRRAAKRAAVAE